MTSLNPIGYESNEMDNPFAVTNQHESEEGNELQEISPDDQWVIIEDGNKQSTDQAQYDLPRDIWKFCIFSQFDYKQLGRMSSVCTKWRKWLFDESLWSKFDLKKLFQRVTWMDVEFWKEKVHFIEEMGVDLSKIPEASKRKTIPVLARLAKEQVDVTLLTMPEKFSFEVLMNLNENYGKLISLPDYEWKLKDRASRCVNRTYTLVIAEGRYAKNVWLSDLKESAKARGCELPLVFETFTMVFLMRLNALPLYANIVVCSETIVELKKKKLAITNGGIYRKTRTISIESATIDLSYKDFVIVKRLT